MLEPNQLYNMDCLAFLEQVQDNSVNLAIIDPPYNMEKADWDTFKNKEKFYAFTYRWIDTIIPKLTKNGSLYIFNTPFNAAYILCYLVKRGLTFQNWITWEKKEGVLTAKRRFGSTQETILFFTKGEDHIFNYDDIRVPYETKDCFNGKSRLKKDGTRWYPNPNGKLCGEVWYINGEYRKNIVNGIQQRMPHPTMKPLEMMERIIKASSVKGDIVLDCFVGSGTTAIAAKKLGRNFLCCDTNNDYIKLAQKRLDETSIEKAMPLFKNYLNLLCSQQDEGKRTVS